MTGDKGSTVYSTALLPVEVGEHRAFLGNPIDVRRSVIHDSVVVTTRVEPTDVVSHDEENVWLACIFHDLPLISHGAVKKSENRPRKGYREFPLISPPSVRIQAHAVELHIARGRSPRIDPV